MKRKPLTDDAGEARELTQADMGAMVPFARMHPELAALLPKPRSTSEGGTDKQSVNLRLDSEIIAHFKAAGPGWQARINETLKNAIRKSS